MKKFIVDDPWYIIEEVFDPENHKIAEAVFSIGNGRMGQRGMFEETYTGASLPGSYLAGVYYPDKTRVGWWKNGYPDSFAKVVNSVNWKSLRVIINDIEVDLYKSCPVSFRRVLDMKKGVLERTLTIRLEDGTLLEITSCRFYSMVHRDLAVMKYSITALNNDVDISIDSILSTDVYNEDANYDEQFWEDFHLVEEEKVPMLICKTKKTHFCTAAAMLNTCSSSSSGLIAGSYRVIESKRIEESFSCSLKPEESVTLVKYSLIKTSFFYPNMDLTHLLIEDLRQISQTDYDDLLNAHSMWWSGKWAESDIEIIGDVAAQQAIRYNIFQLNQTYTGEHSQLNIGPKGFTGEKYGGSTYWDTEAYCIPFYLSTAKPEIALNLLIYRYKQLQKAIENAAILGFTDGAALYPMVTMNGEESHNEWEITFEEIHRNGAIAYAIYDYTEYTGDESYILGNGLEVLIGIARFWSQRATFSEAKQKYVILGVTGPNEYENNVNNNWYTNYIAVWCLNFTKTWLNKLRSLATDRFLDLVKKVNLDLENELQVWDAIIDQMYLPIENTLGIFLQQEGYMDKEQILVKDLDPINLPLNQKWSWDRILRSCFIKQADVLQGLFFFENEFTTEQIRRNFEFYEPRTVHESSLSPCVHSILAAAIGDTHKSYEMYIRTARLDLDNYNNDTEDGLHITSMAGTWMALVKGIGGMRVRGGKLYLAPFLPEHWHSFQFSINFRGQLLRIFIDKNVVKIANVSVGDLSLYLYGDLVAIATNTSHNFNRKIILV